MQNLRLLLAALSSALVCLFVAPAAFAQGALTPPGAPAPMFKTLDQIEARKPLGTPNVVTTSTVVISEPGSYVLVGPITTTDADGIRIEADNVNLDLNGFTISSSASSGFQAGVKILGSGLGGGNVKIQNGMIRGSFRVDSAGLTTGGGFYSGIYAEIEQGHALSVSHVSVVGVRGYGIRLTDHTGSPIPRGALVTNCQVSDFGIGGIHATIVEQSTARLGAPSESTDSAGISGRIVRGCEAATPWAQKGIDAEIVSESTGSGKIGVKASVSVSHSYGFSAVTPNGYGIHCPDGTVSFSRGRAPVGSGTNRSILAAIAIGCTAQDAPIEAPQKHLGTP